MLPCVESLSSASVTQNSATVGKARENPPPIRSQGDGRYRRLASPGAADLQLSCVNQQSLASNPDQRQPSIPRQGDRSHRLFVLPLAQDPPRADIVQHDVSVLAPSTRPAHAATLQRCSLRPNAVASSQHHSTHPPAAMCVEASRFRYRAMPRSRSGRSARTPSRQVNITQPTLLPPCA